MIPNPTRRNAAIQTLRSAEIIRKLHCKRQSECLEFAAKENWLGMSCENCTVDEPLSKEEELEDAEAMADMWKYSATIRTRRKFPKKNE